jgi:diguanylate cyclase (GGDEF)-like protein
MRRSLLAALLLGVALLSGGLLATAGAIAQEHQQQRTVERDAVQVAAAFTSYFERARSLDLLLAQSPAVTPHAGVPFDNDAANRALEYLERLYPGAIGEACLIDERGYELARVTRGIPAAATDLSNKEKENAFFAATLALPFGQVYQAAPYVSQDTHTWVISNSTWVPLAGGQRLIVHFEVSLPSFQQYLRVGSHSLHVAVVERHTGRVILRNGLSLPSAVPLGTFPRLPAATLTPVGQTARSVDVGGRRVAASSIAREHGNANDWLVVEWSTADASTVPPWAGGLVGGFGVVLIVAFLIVLRRQQSVLRVAARLDHLTGLANRRALEEAMECAVSAAEQPGGDRFAVLMIDLDGFKQINDSLGHDVGDVVLQEIGRRLHANTFEFDTAARLGGDEFAVVLRRLREADDVASVAHRLREALIRPIEVDGRPRFIGASVGAAVYGDHGHTAPDLLRAADAAMYQAKRGREGVRVYDAGTDAGSDALGLAADLLVAIEEERIELAFQPEYSLETGAVIGIEALARWRRDDEFIPPSDFIPLAEETGLIRPLTLLTLRKAVREARGWRQDGVDVPVSVNLSARVLGDRSICAEVASILEMHQLTGDALVLEITETALIGDIDVAAEVLQELRRSGVRIELDDFGSGYASFKALQELPLDGVKLDRELVIDEQPGGRRLLAATVDMGRRLGLKVVAEGVEDGATLEAVQGLGVDSAQGFLLGRPMTPEAIRELFGLARTGDTAGQSQTQNVGASS